MIQPGSHAPAFTLSDQDGRIESAVLADLRIGEHERFVRDALRLRGVNTAGG